MQRIAQWPLHAVMYTISAAIAAALAVVLSFTPAPAYADDAAEGPSGNLSVGNIAMGVEDEAGVTYNAPVRAIKEGQGNAEENLSMMNYSLHGTAFIEPQGSAYLVTFYFRDAEVMGQTVYAESLAEASYKRQGSDELVPAERDVYDPLTHTKAVTVQVADLSKPVSVHVHMGTADFYVDADSMAEGVAPIFPQIKLAEGTFKGTLLGVIGGSGNDSGSDVARLSNGNHLVVGSTKSTNQDFSQHASVRSDAFIAEVTSDGDVVDTKVLTGASMSSLFSVSVAEDDSYFVAGYYQETGDDALSGDFEGLNKVSPPGRDGYIAKFDENGKLLWSRGLGGSLAEQFETVIATSDGGCIASAEVMRRQGASYDGEIDSELPGIINAVVVKYDRDGNKEWDVAASCAYITDPQGGLAVRADGSYLLLVERTHSNGLFEGADHFGDYQDGARLVDFELASVAISKDGKAELLDVYGGNLNDSVNRAVVTSDGGFAFVGHTESTTATFKGHATEGDNAYVAKCAADGAIEWVSYLESTGDSSFSSIVETDYGYLAVGTADADDGDFESLAKGGDDAVVATFDKQGNRTSLRTFGGTKDDGASAVIPFDEGRQLVLLTSNSTDAHMKGISRGGNDVVMLATSYEEALVELDDKRAAAELVSEIEALGTVDSLDAAQAVSALRSAYDALSDDAKSYVAASALSTLEAAESSIEALQEEKAKADAAAKAAAEKAAADKAAAEKAAALAAAGTVNTATLTPAQVKTASDLGATTITLGPKVKKIAKGAFAGTKVKTIVVKTKKLKKKSVKGSLKGSKVKTVKVQIGKKKVNKKYVKKYKKIFTKKVAGKKAKVLA